MIIWIIFQGYQRGYILFRRDYLWHIFYWSFSGVLESSKNYFSIYQSHVKIGNLLWITYPSAYRHILVMWRTGYFFSGFLALRSKSGGATDWVFLLGSSVVFSSGLLGYYHPKALFCLYWVTKWSYI